MRTFSRIWVVALMWSVWGCQDGDVRSYDAPKESAASPPAMSSRPPTAVETATWTLPDGWRELPGEGMRYATLVVEEASADGRPALEMRVTPLGLSARDPLANINRWREQIGQPPITADELGDYARALDVDGRQAYLVNLVADPGEHDSPHQILAAIVPGDQRAWFFMILDHNDRLGPYEEAFETFVRSVRIETTAPQMPAGHPPIASGGEAHDPSHGSDANTAAQAAAGVHWETPDGWHAHPGNGSFRVVSFHVGADPAPAEVTVTRFAGGAGSLLPNINRWRGQLGLEPVASVEEQPVERLEVAGAPAQLIDIADESSSESSRARILVVLMMRDDTAWFVKMTGPHEVLESQRDTFLGFARSMHFEAEQS